MPSFETSADNVEWEELRQDVEGKIRMLEAAWRASERDMPEAHGKLVRDLYVPIIAILGEFCASVEVATEDE